MLSQRYACPFLILDEMISLGQLYDFNVEIMNNIVEEKKEKLEWEFFLHKVYDMTYQEYLKEIGHKVHEDPEITDEQIKDIVQESGNILDLF